MKKRLPLTLGIGLILPALIGSGGALADERGSTPELSASELRAIEVTRDGLGLSSDPETILALRASDLDVGTGKWGIPMTAAEEKAVDLPGRGRFANRVATDLGPLVAGRQDFGGMWIDGPTGGVVIGLTDEAPALEAEAREVLAGGRGVQFTMVATPYATLVTAVDEVRRRWDVVGKGIELYAVRAAERSSEVVVEVPEEAVSRAAVAAGALTKDLGVHVSAEAGEPSEDTGCMDRDHCYDPFFAGIRARNGSLNGGGICTMAFHVSQAGDKRWLTAGHCGAAYTSTSWYHTGYGRIGGEVSGGNLVYNGVDAMIVNLQDGESSSIVFSSLVIVTGARYPILNETLCATLGVSSTAHQCGVVQDTYVTWTSNNANATVHGANLSITQIIGDSGSPYYTPGSIWDSVLAVGIGDTSGGYFARVPEALSNLNVTIMTCGYCGH